tara:strand:+ start:345 stop:851 length:507 start_codon:yes stop_codon:yes gene_type:complete
MSQIKVNSIVPVGGLPSGATGGGIIQVVTTFKNDGFSTSSTSFVDITGFNVTITPQSNTSKILIMSCCSMNHDNASGMLRMNLLRGSTNIAEPSVSDSFSSTHSSHFGSETNGLFNWNYYFIDSPATTSAVTYKWQLANIAGTCKINGRASGTNMASTGSVTAMELTN